MKKRLGGRSNPAKTRAPRHRRALELESLEERTLFSATTVAFGGGFSWTAPFGEMAAQRSLEALVENSNAAAANSPSNSLEIVATPGTEVILHLGNNGQLFELTVPVVTFEIVSSPIQTPTTPQPIGVNPEPVVSNPQPVASNPTTISDQQPASVPTEPTSVAVAPASIGAPVTATAVASNSLVPAASSSYVPQAGYTSFAAVLNQLANAQAAANGTTLQPADATQARQTPGLGNHVAQGSDSLAGPDMTKKATDVDMPAADGNDKAPAADGVQNAPPLDGNLKGPPAESPKAPPADSGRNTSATEDGRETSAAGNDNLAQAPLFADDSTPTAAESSSISSEAASDADDAPE